MTALPNPESHDQAVRLERELWQRVGRAALEVPRRGRLRRGVGRDLPNEPADVAQLELLLGRAGYYDLDRREGPTGWWSPTIEHALRKYQKDQGLSVDGWADANGESVQALTGASTAVDTPAPTLRRSLLDDDVRLPAPTGRAAGKASLLDPDRLPFDAKAEARRFIDPRGEDLSPEGEPVQVAGGVGAVPLLGLSVLGMGTALTLQQIEENRRRARGGPGQLWTRTPEVMGRTTPAPPLPPLPPFPIPAPAKPDIVSTPIIEREPTTFANIPPSDLPQGWIEIFPDQREELPQATIFENRGNKETRQFNQDFVGVTTRTLPSWKHEAGSRDTWGKEMREEHLRALKREEKAGTILNSRKVDITFVTPRGNRVRVQSVDEHADGTLTGREQRAADAIQGITEEKPHDILIAVDKRLSSEELNSKHMQDFLRSVDEADANGTAPRYIKYEAQLPRRPR
jgi:hypothetical protein